MKRFLGSLMCACLACTLGAEPFRISCAQGSSSQSLMPLVGAIYEELGISADFALLPAERALRDANAGLCDADVARSAGSISEYPNLVFTHIPLWSICLHAWTLKESVIALNSAASLASFRVGYVRGLKLASAFCERENLSAQVVNSFDSGVKMLMAGRLDLLLSVSPTCCAELARIGKPLPLVLDSAESFHVLNRSHENLVPKFDAILLKMKEDGRYARLTAE